MVTTSIYRGLAGKRLNRLYLCCLPFGYAGVFCLLHFGTDLPFGMVCAISLLIGDAPGAVLAAVLIGLLSLARPEEHPRSTAREP